MTQSVHAPLPAEAVLRTLAALVPGAVEGVIRDLTLAGVTGGASMTRIADEAGCRLVEKPGLREAFALAVAGSRERSVLVVQAGRAPEAGFQDELADALEEGVQRALMRDRPAGLLTRLAPRLSPAGAFLAPRDVLLEADPTRLGRLLRGAPTLRSRLRRVDQPVGR